MWTSALKGAAHVLRGRGFQAATPSRFWRRHGSSLQRFGFRASVQNGAGEGTWFAEVGLDFDELAPLGVAVGAVVVAGVPVWHSPTLLEREWQVGASASAQQLGARLEVALTAACAALEPITDARAALERLDLDAGFFKLKRAQLRFVLGDRGGARAEVERVCAEFPDRAGLEVEVTLRRLGLAGC